jgi:hypothetical protein
MARASASIRALRADRHTLIILIQRPGFLPRESLTIFRGLTKARVERLNSYVVVKLAPGTRWPVTSKWHMPTSSIFVNWVCKWVRVAFVIRYSGYKFAWRRDRNRFPCRLRLISTSRRGARRRSRKARICTRRRGRSSTRRISHTSQLPGI